MAPGELPELPIEHRGVDGERIVLATREPVRAVNMVTGWALERGIELGHFSVSQPSLEDIYLELTGSTEENHHERQGVPA